MSRNQLNRAGKKPSQPATPAVLPGILLPGAGPAFPRAARARSITSMGDEHPLLRDDHFENHAKDIVSASVGHAVSALYPAAPRPKEVNWCDDTRLEIRMQTDAVWPRDDWFGTEPSW